MHRLAGNSVVHRVVPLLTSRPELAGLLGMSALVTTSFADLAADVLAGLSQGNAHVRDIVGRVYRDNPSLMDMSEHDIAEAARRNYEPGGRP